jgi:hypothetical protein
VLILKKSIEQNFQAMSTVEVKSFAAEAGTNGSGDSLAIGRIR